jgi:deazaflavin-dependent oxidoreductase (nitroreductase family)
MATTNNFMKVFNGFSSRVLRSGFHGILSGSTLLITVTGRKTGKKISTPVNYVSTGDEIIITSDQQKIWWQNLRKNQSATILLKNQEFITEARLVESGDELLVYLEKYFSGLPSAAKYLHVTRNADGTFERNSLEIASIGRVIVVCRLPGS